MAIKKLKIGDSIEKLQEYYNGATLSKKTSEPIWEGIVTKVCIPEFRCKPENPNKTSTFDYIIVDVNLVTTWEGDKKKYIEEHKKGISKLVLEKINKTGIGPGGLGGTTTALGVKINTYPTHIAGLPVAVNICCHVNRHSVRTI